MAGHKPSIAILLGMGKSSKDGSPDVGGSGDDEDQAYADAGDSALDAVKKGDGKAFADALCALMDLHAASKDDHAEPDEDDKGKDEEY